MKKVVITGANGFVGRNLIKKLCENGLSILAIVRNEKSDVEFLRTFGNLEIACCELSNLCDFDFAKRDFDVFYHLAWQGVSGEERKDYDLQLKNVKWTCDAANLAKRLGCKKFVSCGSVMEYDCNAFIPLAGSVPNASLDYGSAKIAAHFMSKAECAKCGIEHLWANIASVYGIGSYASTFVNLAALMMLKNEPCNFTKGEQMFDFVHIDDVANALCLVGERGKANSNYFVGSGRPDKLKNFIVKIRDAVNPVLKLNLGAIPFNGVSHDASVFSCERLENDTGFKANVRFEEGIKETVEWLKKCVEEGAI